MAKTLKAVEPESPIQPTLADARFKPHEFETVEELFAARCGWVAPSKRQHQKARLRGEKVVAVGRIGFGGKFVPEEA
ncbi:MAG: hypothetical protein KGL35_05940 [Bradyrhizobium sp.]|nr:hypothetical protein [Bradyrhizobium sp.]